MIVTVTPNPSIDRTVALGTSLTRGEQCGDREHVLSGGVDYHDVAAIDARVRDATEILNTNDGWYPAIDSDGAIRNPSTTSAPSP